jgi:protein ATS1
MTPFRVTNRGFNDFPSTPHNRHTKLNADTDSAAPENSTKLYQASYSRGGQRLSYTAQQTPLTTTTQIYICAQFGTFSFTILLACLDVFPSLYNIHNTENAIRKSMPRHPTLYAFGSNGSGQLGIGHDEDVSFPTRCIFGDVDTDADDVDASSGNHDTSVARIVAGGNHTLVLLGDGRVYAAGCNEDGRCGSGEQSGSESTLSSGVPNGFADDSRTLYRFRRVAVRDEETGKVYSVFKDVSATWEATFLVPATAPDDQEDGDSVYVLGSGVKGELGLGAGIAQTSTATRIPNFPPRGARITRITSGLGHTVVVLSNGDVYGWGGARKGQLGESAIAEKIAWSPLKIEGVPFHVSDAACGREFTVLCGDREAGEFVVLGAAGDKWEIRAGIPKSGSGTGSGSESVKGYQKIDASWHGIYVHQKDRSVLAWGRNDRGQLPPDYLQGVKQVAVGSEHVLALLEDRSVVAFGWGEHGNCGPGIDTQGNIKGVCGPVPLPETEFEAVGVGAGCATSWVFGS